MNEGKIVVGIDAGTSKIATIIARVDETAVNVLGVSEVKSSGIKRGQIVDIEEAVNSINVSLEGAERMAGYSAAHVVVSIGGAHIESLNSKGVVAVSAPQGEISENDLTRVIDAAKAVSLPSSREIIHVLPRTYTVDGQEGIKDPIGMSGIRLEVDTHIVSANSTAIRNLEKALTEVGVDIDGVVYNGYASSLSVLSDTEKEFLFALAVPHAMQAGYVVLLGGYIAHKEVLRWMGVAPRARKGELFVYIWWGTLLAMFIASYTNKNWNVPESMTMLAYEILAYFIVTEVSKAINIWKGLKSK